MIFVCNYLGGLRVTAATWPCTYLFGYVIAAVVVVLTFWWTLYVSCECHGILWGFIALASCELQAVCTLWQHSAVSVQCAPRYYLTIRFRTDDLLPNAVISRVSDVRPQLSVMIKDFLEILHPKTTAWSLRSLKRICSLYTYITESLMSGAVVSDYHMPHVGSGVRWP